MVFRDSEVVVTEERRHQKKEKEGYKQNKRQQQKVDIDKKEEKKEKHGKPLADIQSGKQIFCSPYPEPKVEGHPLTLPAALFSAPHFESERTAVIDGASGEKLTFKELRLSNVVAENLHAKGFESNETLAVIANRKESILASLPLCGWEAESRPSIQSPLRLRFPSSYR